MKPAAPRIIPDERHVIKATAWDALYAAWQIESSNNEGNEIAAMLIKTMDSLLNQVGEKYSTAKTWGAIMPKKFEHDTLYRCTACGSATAKTDWVHYRDGLRICPNCGCIMDLSITNEDPPDQPHHDKPEPEKAAPKPKPAKKSV